MEYYISARINKQSTNKELVINEADLKAIILNIDIYLVWRIDKEST